MRLQSLGPVPDGVPAGACILCGDEATRDAIAYWLQSLPVNAAVAADGYHANRILRSAACKLLVTDRILPPWPGLETFRVLRERNPRLRIAFVDNGSRDDWILARITGATDFLARPLTRAAVVDALSPGVPAARLTA